MSVSISISTTICNCIYNCVYIIYIYLRVEQSAWGWRDLLRRSGFAKELHRSLYLFLELDLDLYVCLYLYL